MFEFKIEESIGVIRMKRKFDRGIGDRRFLFYVIVVDGIGKSLKVIVNIDVISVYDLVFKFKLELYSVFV